MNSRFIGLKIAIFLSTALLFTGTAQGQTPQAQKPAEKATPPPPSPPEDVKLTKDIQFGQAGEMPLYLHLCVPKTAPNKPLPLIVVIHGGGWQIGTRDSRLNWAYDFAQHGYASATIDYRLVKQAPFPAQIQDCKCAIRFLRANAAKYNLDPDHIGVTGESAGGHLTALLALTENIADFEGDGGSKGVSSRVQAACDWFGVSDFLAWCYDPKVGNQYSNDKGLAVLFGGPPLENPAKAHWASPIAHVQSSANTPPFLIIHGDRDPLVPLNQALSLADALQKKGADITLRVIPNMGHDIPKFTSSAWLEMIAFFDRTLKSNTK